jgi:hypothetical protein
MRFISDTAYSSSRILGRRENVKYRDLKRGLLLVFEFNTAVNLKVRVM